MNSVARIPEQDANSANTYTVRITKEQLNLSEQELSNIFKLPAEEFSEASFKKEVIAFPEGSIKKIYALGSIGSKLNNIFVGHSNPADAARSTLDEIKADPEENNDTALSMILTGDEKQISAAVKLVDRHFENEIS